MFSYPKDVTELLPSWSSCTLDNIIGVMDPPHTLGKATFMAPHIVSSPLASPAAGVTPAHAPATPTKDPQTPLSTTPVLPNDLTGPGDPGDPGGSPDASDPRSGQLRSMDTPNNDRPTHNPPKHDPHSTKPLSTNPLSTNHPGNDPPSNDPPSNDPPSNDPTSNDLHPLNNDPFNGNPSSVNPASPRPSQEPSKNDPASVNAQNGDQTPSQGIGALIASAFGFVASPMPSPTDDPATLDSDPQPIRAIFNGSPSPVMAGGAPMSRAANGAVLVAGQTIAQGGQATVSGAVISLGNDNVAVNGITHTFPPPGAVTLTLRSVGENSIQRAPDGSLIPTTQAVTPDNQATIYGVVAAGGAGNAATIEAGQATPVTVGSQLFTPSPSLFMVAGMKVAAGGPAVTIAGISINLGPSGEGLVVGKSRLPVVAFASSPESPAPITVGDEIFTQNSTGFSIAGTSIWAGGPGVVIAGTSISLQPNGEGLVIGSSTIPAAPLTAPTASLDSNTPITIGTEIFTPNPTGFPIVGTTVSAGGPGVTIEGTVISLAPSGGQLIVGTITRSLPQLSTPPPSSPSLTTIGNQFFTPKPTGFSIGSTTLSPGGPGLTIDGTVVNLEPLGSSRGGELVVGSRTIAIGATETKTGTAIRAGSESAAAAERTSNTVSQSATATSSNGSASPSARGKGLASSASCRSGLGGIRDLVYSIVVGFLGAICPSVR